VGVETALLSPGELFLLHPKREHAQTVMTAQKNLRAWGINFGSKGYQFFLRPKTSSDSLSSGTLLHQAGSNNSILGAPFIGNFVFFIPGDTHQSSCIYVFSQIARYPPGSRRRCERRSKGASQPSRCRASWTSSLRTPLRRMEASRRSCRKPRWSQWVDATLSSDPHSMKTKAKSAG
jgi:hypothetical protein